MVYTYDNLFVSYKYPSTELPNTLFTTLEEANECAKISNENLKKMTFYNNDTPLYEAMSLYQAIEMIKEVVEENAEVTMNNWGDDSN